MPPSPTHKTDYTAEGLSLLTSQFQRPRPVSAIAPVTGAAAVAVAAWALAANGATADSGAVAGTMQPWTLAAAGVAFPLANSAMTARWTAQGSSASSLADLTGNGNTLTATGSSGLAFNASGSKGKACITFAAGNDYFGAAARIGADPSVVGFSWYCIARTTAIAGTTDVTSYEPPNQMLSDDGSFENLHLDQRGAFPDVSSYAVGGTAGNRVTGTTAMNGGTSQLIVATWNPTTTTLSLSLNGTATGTPQVFTIPSYSSGTFGFKFLGSGGGATTRFIGDIFEAGLVTHVLTSGEQSSLAAYAAATY